MNLLADLEKLEIVPNERQINGVEIILRLLITEARSNGLGGP